MIMKYFKNIIVFKYTNLLLNSNPIYKIVINCHTKDFENVLK